MNYERLIKLLEDYQHNPSRETRLEILLRTITALNRLQDEITEEISDVVKQPQLDVINLPQKGEIVLDTPQYRRTRAVYKEPLIHVWNIIQSLGGVATRKEILAANKKQKSPILPRQVDIILQSGCRDQWMYMDVKDTIVKVKNRNGQRQVQYLVVGSPADDRRWIPAIAKYEVARAIIPVVVANPGVVFDASTLQQKTGLPLEVIKEYLRDPDKHYQQLKRPLPPGELRGNQKVIVFQTRN